jgi:hypothetical protein
MTSFGGTCPYFWLCPFFNWQDLQDLVYNRMVLRIPFQYILDLQDVSGKGAEVLVIPANSPVL